MAGRRGRDKKCSVFVSFSNTDRAVVMKIRAALETSAYASSWLQFVDDSKLPMGVGENDWRKKVEGAIHRASFFLFFVSPASTASTCWAYDELILASAKKKPVIPVLLDLPADFGRLERLFTRSALPTSRISLAAAKCSAGWTEEVVRDFATLLGDPRRHWCHRRTTRIAIVTALLLTLAALLYAFLPDQRNAPPPALSARRSPTIALCEQRAQAEPVAAGRRGLADFVAGPPTPSLRPSLCEEIRSDSRLLGRLRDADTWWRVCNGGDRNCQRAAEAIAGLRGELTARSRSTLDRGSPGADEAFRSGRFEAALVQWKRGLRDCWP